MFPRKKNRIGALVALAAALALILPGPASAAGPAGWGEARELAAGLFQRILAWARLVPDPGMVLKCDQGSTIDPNGCKKTADGGQGSGTLGLTSVTAGAETEAGSHIDPDGHH